MKLSIIIPVYRVEATLGRCLKSIVTQSFADFEVILVDDGSPDRCPQLCDEWAERDRRISVIHQANGGLSAARNSGLAQSRGDFLMFADSDDFLGDGTLSAVMPLAENTDLLEFPVWRHWGSSRQQLLSFPERSYNHADDYWLHAQAYTHCYAWNKVYRRWLFNDVSFPEGRVFEDVYTLPRLLKKQPRISTTGKGCYYYCQNNEGITTTATGRELAMLLDAHLTSAMPVDDDYYYHLLNIQIDVCRMAGCEPQLQPRRLKLQGEFTRKVKSLLLNMIGIRKLCNLYKTVESLKPTRS